MVEDPGVKARTATIHVRTKTSVGAKMCECAQFPRLVMRYGCRRARNIHTWSSFCTDRYLEPGVALESLHKRLQEEGMQEPGISTRGQASALTAVPAASDRPCVLPGGLQASCVFGHRLRQQASRLSDGCWLMVVSCWLLDVGCWCRSHRRRHYSSPRPRLHRCRHW